MRTLTRLQSLLAGSAFALASIGGVSTAALADTGAQPATDTTTTTTTATTAVADTAAPAPAAGGPSAQELHPVAISGEQKRATPDAEQLANAQAIVQAGKDMGLSPRAWTIAVATSLQESNLHNIGHLGASNDHDSLGLFQQRPSSGWGTAEQIQDPHYAATQFFQGLVEVPGWDSLALTQAAQKVQVSAYPGHYAKHEAQAGDIISALHGTGPYADAATNL